MYMIAGVLWNALIAAMMDVWKRDRIVGLHIQLQHLHCTVARKVLMRNIELDLCLQELLPSLLANFF